MTCSTPCEVLKHGFSITNIMILVTTILVYLIVDYLVSIWRGPWYWTGIGVTWAWVSIYAFVWAGGFFCGNFLCKAPDICEYGLMHGWKIPCW